MADRCPCCAPPPSSHTLDRGDALMLIAVAAVGLYGWLEGLPEAKATPTPTAAPVATPAAEKAPPQPTAPPAPPAPAPAPSTRGALADNPRLTLTPRARHDLRAGTLDPKLLRLLGELLADHTLTVTVFATGHTKYVGGDPSRQVSQHWYGQAADIFVVDGRPVRADHTGARRIVEHLAARPPSSRPTEIGSPFAGPHNRLRGVFTDRAHADHIHLGVRGMGT